MDEASKEEQALGTTVASTTLHDDAFPVLAARRLLAVTPVPLTWPSVRGRAFRLSIRALSTCTAVIILVPRSAARVVSSPLRPLILDALTSLVVVSASLPLRMRTGGRLVAQGGVAVAAGDARGFRRRLRIRASPRARACVVSWVRLSGGWDLGLTRSCRQSLRLRLRLGLRGGLRVVQHTLSLQFAQPGLVQEHCVVASIRQYRVNQHLENLGAGVVGQIPGRGFVVLDGELLR